MLRDLAAVPHAVYRVYDEPGRLLYVGISVDPDQRLRAHSYSAVWAPEYARHTLDWCDSRPAALAAETRAIWLEHPVFNDQQSVCRCGGLCPVCATAAAHPYGWPPRKGRLVPGLGVVILGGGKSPDSGDFPGRPGWGDLRLTPPPAHRCPSTWVVLPGSGLRVVRDKDFAVVLAHT